MYDKLLKPRQSFLITLHNLLFLYFVAWEGPRCLDKYNRRYNIWTREVQNKLVEKVAGNVGYYPTLPSIVQNFNVLFMWTSLDSQSVYGYNLFQIKRALVSWNYLNILKVINFKRHLRLLKRKINWQAAGNALCYPTFAATSSVQSRSFLHKTYWG